MPEKNDEILELVHSEAVDEIISKPPSWIVRRGTVIIIVIIALAFAGALLIEYPDVIRARVSIEATATGKYQVVSSLKYEMSGRIKTGQKAIIKLRQYKYDSYGYLAATVSGISNASDSVVTVYMNLDKGLVTSTGKRIPSQVKSVGELQIIGEKQTLFQRLFFRE